MIPILEMGRIQRVNIGQEPEVKRLGPKMKLQVLILAIIC